MKINYIAGIYAEHFKRFCDKQIEGLREAGHQVNFFTQQNAQVSECDIVHLHSCFSEDIMRQYKSKYPRTKIILQRDSAHQKIQHEWVREGAIWAGVDTSPYEINLDTFLNEYELADYILLASNMEIDTFIREGVKPQKIFKAAFAVDFEHYKISHKKLSNPFTVVFGGGEPIRKALPVVQKACQILNVSLISRYHHSQVVPMYSNTHIFAMPAFEDGYPVSSLEAMSCSTPVIITERTGTCELVVDGHSGFIIKPGDLDALVEKIKYYMDHPEMIIVHGRNARRMVMTNDWENYKRNIVNMYKEIFGSSSAALTASGKFSL